jgi:hypothetical protein
MDFTGSLAIYLLPGMSATIEAMDAFADMGSVTHRYTDGSIKEDVATLNGFVVDSEATGTIMAVSGRPAVTYKHKKYNSNTITFYSRTGAVGRVDIVSVPIHDHASIVTGGPAFGTYFSDDETVEEP